jgi:hypothetical protein
MIVLKEQCFKSLSASCYIIMSLLLDEVWQMSLFFFSGMQISLLCFFLSLVPGNSIPIQKKKYMVGLYHLVQCHSCCWENGRDSTGVYAENVISTNVRLLMLVLWPTSEHMGEWATHAATLHRQNQDISQRYIQHSNIFLSLSLCAFHKVSNMPVLFLS